MSIGKTKEFSTREMERILLNNGFHRIRHSGDHRIWKRDSDDGMVVLNRKINAMICRRIIKENNLVF